MSALWWHDDCTNDAQKQLNRSNKLPTSCQICSKETPIQLLAGTNAGRCPPSNRSTSEAHVAHPQTTCIRGRRLPPLGVKRLDWVWLGGTRLRKPLINKKIQPNTQHHRKISTFLHSDQPSTPQCLNWHQSCPPCLSESNEGLPVVWQHHKHHSNRPPVCNLVWHPCNLLGWACFL